MLDFESARHHDRDGAGGDVAAAGHCLTARTSTSTSTGTGRHLDATPGSANVDAARRADRRSGPRRASGLRPVVGERHRAPCAGCGLARPGRGRHDGAFDGHRDRQPTPPTTPRGWVGRPRRSVTVHRRGHRGPGSAPLGQRDGRAWGRSRTRRRARHRPTSGHERESARAPWPTRRAPGVGRAAAVCSVPCRDRSGPPAARVGRRRLPGSGPGPCCVVDAVASWRLAAATAVERRASRERLVRSPRPRLPTTVANTGRPADAASARTWASPLTSASLRPRVSASRASSRKLMRPVPMREPGGNDQHDAVVLGCTQPGDRVGDLVVQVEIPDAHRARV